MAGTLRSGRLNVDPATLCSKTHRSRFVVFLRLFKSAEPTCFLLLCADSELLLFGGGSEKIDQ